MSEPFHDVGADRGRRTARPSQAAVIGVVVAVAVVLGGTGVLLTDPAPSPGSSSPWANVSPVLPNLAGVGTGAGTSSSGSVGQSGLTTLSSSASQHQYAATVQNLLERHFSAINTRDFDAWSTTVEPRRAAEQSSSSWSREYRSTRDSNVQVTSITTGDTDRVTVGLTFVSDQDPVDAPADLPVSRICWTSRWPVSSIASGGRIGIPPPRTTSRRAC